MISDIEVGQVLSLRIRFNNQGDLSGVRHPYLVVKLREELNAIEVAQMDSLFGKEYKAAMRSNKVIMHDKPMESVIDKDSYVQMDNTFLLEDCAELTIYRRHTDKLSAQKLQTVIQAYESYHKTYCIDENKQVFMTAEEIKSLNT